MWPQHGRTILFVSHNMSALSQLCERAVLLEKGFGQVNRAGKGSDPALPRREALIATGHRPSFQPIIINHASTYRQKSFTVTAAWVRNSVVMSQ